jgi:glycosyltransferase involved in cell wall biosynthesis
VLLFREACRGADVVAVHSELAARLARADLDGTLPVHVVPFGHPAPRARTAERSEVVASFGFVAVEKHVPLLLDAMQLVVRRRPAARLRLVGHADAPVLALIDAAVERLGLSGVVSVTGRLDDTAYARELEGAAVAVQLRAIVNGEASAAVADCLAAGAPTIVSDNGAQAELPDDAVVKVPPDAPADVVAAAILFVLDDRERADGLAAGGQRHAERSSFAVAADALSDLLDHAPAPRL